MLLHFGGDNTLGDLLVFAMGLDVIPRSVLSHSPVIILQIPLIV